MKEISEFKYGIDRLTVSLAMKLAKGEIKGVLSDECITKVEQSVGNVQHMVQSNQIVYGINTGFGPLCDTLIDSDDTAKLQHNLLKSHAVGVGEPIQPILAKLMLIIKVQALVQGFSGVRLSTIERILWMIDNDCIPVVPEQGSVGASGDLAPLSHAFLPLIGLGEVYFNGRRLSTEEALNQAGLHPLTLGPKEGLGLINGTQFIAAHAVYGVYKFHHLLELADIAGAMSLEGMMGSYKPFDPRLHSIRAFPGNQLVAHRLWTLLKDSEIANSHPNCGRVQDPYSLRCMPQVHGASRTAWEHLKHLTEIEINSVTDNPIVLGPEDSISGGNFHGQPLAMALDYACVAAAEIGNIADRRCYLIIEGKYGLPKLLVEDAGLHSGFMIPQYTTAALVSENKGLCFPASADSIPTSLGQEDHVSMGSIGGRKFNRVLQNLSYILSVEFMYAAQAIDFRRPLKSSPILEAVHQKIREKVAFTKEDRIFSVDMNSIQKMIDSEELISLIKQVELNNNLNLNTDQYDTFKLS